MIGYIYLAANKYNLHKCIDILKKNRRKYTIYDEYFIVDKKIDEFNLKYYVKYIGTTNIKKFANNEITEEYKIKKEISGHNCKFIRKEKYYILKIKNTNIIFKRKKKYDYIFDKIFTEKNKNFFEFSFNEIYTSDNKYIENLECRNLDEYFDVDIDELDEGLKKYEDFEFDKEIIKLEDYENNKFMKNFNISNYFKFLTRNQLIIFVLSFLLCLSNKAISVLMDTSTTYIFLEKKRIIKKIKKIITRELCP